MTTLLFIYIQKSETESIRSVVCGVVQGTLLKNKCQQTWNTTEQIEITLLLYNEIEHRHFYNKRNFLIKVRNFSF